MVKDHHFDVTESNVTKILEGDLRNFLEEIMKCKMYSDYNIHWIVFVLKWVFLLVIEICIISGWYEWMDWIPFVMIVLVVKSDEEWIDGFLVTFSTSSLWEQEVYQCILLWCYKEWNNRLMHFMILFQSLHSLLSGQSHYSWIKILFL